METYQKRQKTAVARKDLLYHMEKLVEMLKDSNLSSDFFKRASRHIDYVAEKLELTREQSVLMSLFIDKSDENHIYISDLAEYIKCRTVRIIRFMPDIDELERRELVRCCRSERRASYRVPIEVIEAIKDNRKFIPRDLSNLSCPELFAEIDSIFEQRNDIELTYEQTAEKLKHLLESNKQLLFTQKVLAFGFDEHDFCLLMLFCHLFINNNDDHISFHDIKFLYRRTFIYSSVKANLQYGEHILQEARLIDFSGDDGFKNRDTFMLTKSAKAELFTELKISSLSEDKIRGGLLHHEEIEQKPLFYEPGICSQIEELRNLLEEENYRKVRSRLQENGFRCGLTCLFYGLPGTGKTETVLQLARHTGRDIFQVNISEIKSMWVGESEKNIKQLFDSYQQKVKEMTLAPILLFNEADAIIGKRMEGAQKAVEKMENSVQNIILQAMETLDGILIATTNLAQNMDTAFERRFLYKINFTKPNMNARKSIWQSMMPTLSESDLETLASHYDFSGGQIENIARHYAIDNILHGSENSSLAQLMQHCEQETLNLKKPSRQIGFH